MKFVSHNTGDLHLLSGDERGGGMYHGLLFNYGRQQYKRHNSGPSEVYPADCFHQLEEIVLIQMGQRKKAIISALWHQN